MKITLTIDTETGALVKAEQQLKKTAKAADKSKKSYFIETYFELKDGSMVRIYCNNWSEKLTKKNGWKDSLNVVINDIEFLNFLRESY